MLSARGGTVVVLVDGPHSEDRWPDVILGRPRCATNRKEAGTDDPARANFSDFATDCANCLHGLHADPTLLFP